MPRLRRPWWCPWPPPCPFPLSHHADAQAEKDKVWSLALKPDSVLLSPAGAAKMAASDCLLAAHMGAALLSSHTHRLEAVEGEDAGGRG